MQQKPEPAYRFHVVLTDEKGTEAKVTYSWSLTVTCWSNAGTDLFIVHLSTIISVHLASAVNRRAIWAIIAPLWTGLYWRRWLTTAWPLTMSTSASSTDREVDSSSSQNGQQGRPRSPVCYNVAGKKTVTVPLFLDPTLSNDDYSILKFFQCQILQYIFIKQYNLNIIPHLIGSHTRRKRILYRYMSALNIVTIKRRPDVQAM